MKLEKIVSTGNEVLVVPERHIELLVNVIERLKGKVPPKSLERFVLHLKAVEDTTNMTTRDGLPVPEAVREIVWDALHKEFVRMFGNGASSTSYKTQQKTATAKSKGRPPKRK